jgi:SAM-dependent methyltransferase
MKYVSDSTDSLRILELGCGLGLPACTLLRRVLESSYTGHVHVVFQDYDMETIDGVTRPSVSAHLANLSTGSHNRITITYQASPWENMMTPPHVFDIILSSECIYREDLFVPFTQVLTSHLSPTGIALIAGKRYYFGCGGGTIEYSIFLESQKGLSVTLLHTIEDGSSNTREILMISRVS